jgi:hypothetical protein
MIGFGFKAFYPRLTRKFFAEDFGWVHPDTRTAAQPPKAFGAARSGTVPVREPKTRGGTPLLPAGEDADATIPPRADEFLVRVSRGAGFRFA